MHDYLINFVKMLFYNRLFKIDIYGIKQDKIKKKQSYFIFKQNSYDIR